MSKTRRGTHGFLSNARLRQMPGIFQEKNAIEKSKKMRFYPILIRYASAFNSVLEGNAVDFEQTTVGNRR
jgi:hypothetical protein